MWRPADLRRLVAMHQMPQPSSPQPAALPGARTPAAGCSLPQARAVLALAPLLCALSGVVDLCVARGVASWIWAEPVLLVVASIVAASAAQLRRQAAELQASRTRIVAAADSERRRIERDLHDGAQQRLTALAIKVSMACELAGHDAGQARDLLAELRADVRETAEELRHLAHGIYPPLLAESGLRTALAAAAGRSTLPVTVQAAGLARYPADVEATVYFCCLEAIQNAGKHAGDGACSPCGSGKRGRRWPSTSPTTAAGSMSAVAASARASPTWRTGCARCAAACGWSRRRGGAPG
jgi:hypothetical protein